MTKPRLYASVYIIRWPHMVKVGYTMNRRWREVSQRNRGSTQAVWHFDTGRDALNAEALAQRVADEWGMDAKASDLPNSRGYTECRTVANPNQLIAELIDVLDMAGGDRCTDVDWCGLSPSECR